MIMDPLSEYVSPFVRGSTTMIGHRVVFVMAFHRLRCGSLGNTLNSRVPLSIRRERSPIWESSASTNIHMRGTNEPMSMLERGKESSSKNKSIRQGDTKEMGPDPIPLVSSRAYAIRRRSSRKRKLTSRAIVLSVGDCSAIGLS